MNKIKKINNKVAIQKYMIVFLLALLVVYLIALLFPVTRPHAQYPLYFIKCGGQPIIGEKITTPKYFYYMPGSSDYEVTIFKRFFFCSEQEAQAAGFKKK